jgi:hypothetical protein
VAAPAALRPCQAAGCGDGQGWPSAGRVARPKTHRVERLEACDGAVVPQPQETKAPRSNDQGTRCNAALGPTYFLASFLSGVAFAAFFRSAGLMPVELVMMSHETPCSNSF